MATRAVLLSAALLALLAPLSLAQFNMTLPTGPGKACPSDPLAFCDFYFTGFETKVPVINVTNRIPDTALTTPLRTRRNPQLAVFVAQSGPELLFAPVTRNTLPTGFSRDINNMFYLGGKPSALRLRKHRTPPQFLSGRCVLLPVRSAQITTRFGAQMCNLNPYTTGLLKCPEARPCVVFRTK